MTSGRWTSTIQDADELRAAFTGDPSPPYRPVPFWWWSGEPLDEERLLWQVEQLAALGCGGFTVLSLAPFRPSLGTRADHPPALSPEWLRLFRTVCERAAILGLGVFVWSPLMAGGPIDVHRLAEANPAWAGWRRPQKGAAALPYGVDYGNPEAIDALVGPGTAAGRLLDAVGDLLGTAIVGMFEDEFPVFARFAPGFAADFVAMKGYEPPLDALDRDVGPRTPAMRWDLFDVAATRAARAYTAWQRRFVDEHGLLGAYDQMNRKADPCGSSFAYFDPFRTMAWAGAPGSDQMGDIRFHLSLARVLGAPRVCLEGFHSHGWGHRLAEQARLLVEWGREGANLFMPHGGYYATRGLWWEWAPPETFWRQPYARHYPAFARWVGRLMMVLAAGRHVPEVAVLYPLSTVWAASTGDDTWDAPAVDAAQCYLRLAGLHGAPSRWEPERASTPSLLADAGYDRATVDEANVDRLDVPVIVPGCLCLQTRTVRCLLDASRHGRLVIIVEPRPAWSAERGRDDPDFTGLVDELCTTAVVVPDTERAVAELERRSPPRVTGLASQWRRVSALDVVFLTGRGQARLRGMADRRPERWDATTGRIDALGARVDGDDLIIDVDGPGTIVALPPGTAAPPASYDEEAVALPEVWACTYLPWGENRWGDLLLPPNPGPAPVPRRTFAHREGDDPTWRSAPVVPEDVQHPIADTGFEAHMAGATGRPPPTNRDLGGGWREVVSTYGPKAAIDGERVEYSERLGVEDLRLTTHIGLKGFIEPVKVDLGTNGGGRVVTYGHVPNTAIPAGQRVVPTHLVVEGTGIVTIALDGRRLVGPVDLGVVTVPVELAAGWHEVVLDAQPRPVAASPLDDYIPLHHTRLAWAFCEPYERDPISVWGSPLRHPDYKGGGGQRRFRRRVRVPEAARVTVDIDASGPVTFDIPSDLGPGEHLLEFVMGASEGLPYFRGAVSLSLASRTSVQVVTDTSWETAGEGSWERVFPMTTATTCVPESVPVPRRHPLLEVGWLEGDDAAAGHVADAWADSPQPPPPAWFCFTAPPGATSMTLPTVGAVEAWLDGEPGAPDGGVLPLRPGARVALRVEPPAGRRGAACFTEHPELNLGPGEIPVGTSWHRLGLDCFSGIILHTAEIDIAGDDLDGLVDAVLDLGEVAGTVAVRVNGHDAGVLFCAPWRLPVPVAAGTNRIELEVANTLGPMAARGIPTPFAPEDQRTSGLLGQPRLVLRHRPRVDLATEVR